ncbi:MAG: ribonucleoside-diphosphate reductase subunit alpha [Minisyncoccia bacterium]
MREVTQIKKRNGNTVPFEKTKIVSAMKKAFASQAVSITEEKLLQLVDVAVTHVHIKFQDSVPTVENIQDVVEMALMQAGYFDVAKAYIIYRYEHTKERQEEVQELIEDNALYVTKKDGKKEKFSVDKIRACLLHYVKGYEKDIDVEKIVNQVTLEVYNGIPTKDVFRSLIMTVRSRIEIDPAYSKVAARLLLTTVYTRVFGEEVDMNDTRAALKKAFPKYITEMIEKGKFDPRMKDFDLEALAEVLEPSRDHYFEYMGLEILHSRYLLEDMETKCPYETPQMFWMRIAMGTALNEAPEKRMEVVKEFYYVLSEFLYTPGGRTLYQSGVVKAQLSNCFLNVVPDDLNAIFKTYSDNAQLLKWSGGVGTAWSKVRATGAVVKSVEIESQGVVPYLKIANDINVAIMRGGKRRSAACAYLETWHYDIEDFLELRKNTGDERRRTHDINTANWIPDLFMKRVRENKDWTLFSPDETPDLPELFGKKFDEAYEKYEKMVDEGKIRVWKRLPAKDLWKKMLAMLFETGHPWITWKDPCNVRSPQDHVGVIHNSNLCTEITLNTSPDETAVCNIGSVNFAKFVVDKKLDHTLLQRVMRAAVRMTDNTLDINFYPTEDAKRSNARHRPIGLGIRGYHDALYALGIRFDTNEAVEFADESMEVMAYYTILASSELAKEKGAYGTFKGSKWDRGLLPQDTVDLLEKERGMKIDVPRGGKMDWTPVREHIKRHGMRNSNTMAIAPTASTANLVGCIPCIEPIYKNIYVKSNKEGDFVVVNKYLVQDLKARNLWNEDMLGKLKFNDGSVQNIKEIPDDLKQKYTEVFEIDQKWLMLGASRRAKWMDQSQSVNVFFKGTSGKDLSDVYMLAWELGLKTTYYLRTLGASQVEKSTVSTSEFGATHTRASGKKPGESAHLESPVVGAQDIPSPLSAIAMPLEKVTIQSSHPNQVPVQAKPLYNLHRPDNNEECESCSA